MPITPIITVQKGLCAAIRRIRADLQAIHENFSFSHLFSVWHFPRVNFFLPRRLFGIGIAGWYAIQAQEQGLIGISMTNTSPVLCPTRSKVAALGNINILRIFSPDSYWSHCHFSLTSTTAVLVFRLLHMNRTLNPCTRSVAGTNPIAFAAPATDGDSMILDMATTGSIQSCFCHKFRSVHLLKYMLSVLFLPLTPSYVPFFRCDSWSLRIMFIASMRSISSGTAEPE